MSVLSLLAATQNFLCIDYKGDIYPCGKFADLHDYRLGSIHDMKFDPLDCPSMKELMSRRTVALPSKCTKCQYLNLCHAGCNAEALMSNGLEQPSALCSDYRALFDFATSEGLTLLRTALPAKKERTIGGTAWNMKFFSVNISRHPIAQSSSFQDCIGHYLIAAYLRQRDFVAQVYSGSVQDTMDVLSRELGEKHVGIVGFLCCRR